MSEVRFYHLTRGTLETAIAVMLRRLLQRGQRAVVQLGSEERVEALASYLWTFDDTSFLPHGTAKDGQPQLQPIWLTARDEPPHNGADVLFLGDGAESEHMGNYDLCVFLFDGVDENAVARARELWRGFKTEGLNLTYWQQDNVGRWSKKEG
ncbi:MAG: DNA polymerase III subunit chi [Kiloniellales bacterium]|nr:DNA polymerase III subunit chi [Kiloniellales bacterium]